MTLVSSTLQMTASTTFASMEENALMWEMILCASVLLDSQELYVNLESMNV